VPALAAAAAAAYQTAAAASAHQCLPHYVGQVLAVAALLLVVLVPVAVGQSHCLPSHPSCSPLVLVLVSLGCCAGLVQCLAVQPQTRCYPAANLGLLLLLLAVGVQAPLVLVVMGPVAPPCHHCRLGWPPQGAA
jgi:hypothetical protein